MNKFAMMIAGIGIASAAVPATAMAAAPASASSVHVSIGFQSGYQGGAWQNINARQHRIESQINQGIRSGRIDRREASRLRSEFRKIERLEAQYRKSRPGLTAAERRDLDRRMDALERSIRLAKMDDRRPGRR